MPGTPVKSSSCCRCLAFQSPPPPAPFPSSSLPPPTPRRLMALLGRIDWQVGRLAFPLEKGEGEEEGRRWRRRRAYCWREGGTVDRGDPTPPRLPCGAPRRSPLAKLRGRLKALLAELLCFPRRSLFRNFSSGASRARGGTSRGLEVGFPRRLVAGKEIPHRPGVGELAVGEKLCLCPGAVLV